MEGNLQIIVLCFVSSSHAALNTNQMCSTFNSNIFVICLPVVVYHLQTDQGIKTML